jgi:hypothetical protein
MVDLRPLKGARIWLAGSLSGEADSAALANFQAFVREFGARVFAQDGTNRSWQPSLDRAVTARGGRRASEE